MKRLAILFLFFTLFAFSQNRYVTPAGGGDGTTISTPWSLQQMVGNVQPGMHVYVREGDYGSGTYNISTDGLSGAPIIIEGVDQDFNDINVTNRAFYTRNESLSASDMPLLDSGLTLSNQGSGTGITISGDWIELKNFAVIGYAKGMAITGSNNLVDNLNFDLNGDHRGDNAAGGGNWVYCCSGYNLDVKGSNNTIRNIFGRDGSHVGVTLASGGSHTAQNVEIYSSNLPTGNTTDYQFFIQSSNNTANNISVIRELGTLHRSHGIVFKPNGIDAAYNVIEGFYLENSKIEIQFGRTHHNVVRNGLIVDNSSWTSDSADKFYSAATIVFANGAHDNLVENVIIKNATSCVTCSDWDDGASSNPADDAPNAGLNNTINNILCWQPRESAIWHDDAALVASNFRIFNSTFVRGPSGGSLFRLEGISQDWELDIYNTQIDGFTNFVEKSGTTQNVAAASVFNKINISGGSLTPSTFSSYADTDITNHTVGYVDAANDDYTPSTDVLEIGGDFTSLLTEQGNDLNKLTRTAPFTIGAFERSGTNPNPPTPTPPASAAKKRAFYRKYFDQ